MRPVQDPTRAPGCPTPRVARIGWRTTRADSGQGLVEFLLVVPMLVLLLFGIVELGAAWRTFQVVTHTAREGARIAVLPVPDVDEPQVRAAIDERLSQGGLDPDLATVEILCPESGGDCFSSNRSGRSTEIHISYPHTFVFLGPLVEFVGSAGGEFGTVTLMTASVMRNE